MALRLNRGDIKAVLVDLSGTLHIENEATPGAVEALERLSHNQILVINMMVLLCNSCLKLITKAVIL